MTSFLSELLSKVLPKSHDFTIHHISTPPTKHDPIYNAPPNTKPDRTFLESHFLQVSIPSPSGPLFIFAIEVLIYTTRHLTTLFVSKADSTGFCPKYPNHASPLRNIATTFIHWLVTHRLRPGISFVIDLFARASDQYLYPGSVENNQKHISDDRQLIKWWCRVLSPILDSYASPSSSTTTSIFHPSEVQKQTTAKAYLLVPGEDSISSFTTSRWTNGHPLHSISRFPGAPPRCLIPHFPDDPKGRYLSELDDEIPDSQNSLEASPSKRGNGEWRSIKSVDQFWEMMAYRSEMASGRLVGFIWVVFATPPVQISSPTASTSMLATPSKPKSKSQSLKTPAKSDKPKKLAGPIPHRLPRILQPSKFSIIPSLTPWYTWPSDSRGTLVLTDASYDKAIELLLQMDFTGTNAAVQSTQRWTDEVGVLAGARGQWGISIIGEKEEETRNGSITSGSVNVLSIKRKNKSEHSLANGVESKRQKSSEPLVESQPVVNVLSAGMVRKKPKKVAPQPVG